MDEERQGSTEQTGKVIRISGGEAFKPKSRAGDQKELIPGPGTIEWARSAYISMRRNKPGSTTLVCNASLGGDHMHNTIAETGRIPGLETYLEKASALELARRSLLGAPVYTIISLIMLVGTPMLMDYGWWSAAEVILLIMLGGIRVWFAMGFEHRYAQIGEQAVFQFSILTALQSLTLGVLAAMVIWQYWAAQEVVLTIVLSAGSIAAGTSALSVRRSAHIIFLACVLVPFGIAVYIVGGPAKALLIIGFLVLMAFLVQDGGQARSAYFQYLKDGYADMISRRRTALESQARRNFMRDIGHEIRTPVNSIIGMAALLLDEKLSQRSREFAQAIRKNSSILLNLVGNVPGAINTDLDVHGAGLDALDLHLCIQNVMDLYLAEASEKGIELTAQLEDLPEGLMSPEASQLEQVLANLLANALQFTEQGTVTVSSSCQNLQDGTLRIEFSVADTGPGIPAERLESVFDPFNPATASGSDEMDRAGLGLPLCKGLVALMGGDIWIESGAGQGTTVRFTMRVELDPSFDSLSQQDDKVLEASENTLGRKLSHDYPHNILVVDDDDIHRQIMCVQLSKMGYQADQAADGEQAVAAVMKGRYDLIFMDLRMPNMDGIESSIWIRERFNSDRDVRIIALTGDATLEARQQCRRAGIDSFVTKPAKIRDIEAILKQSPADQPKIVHSLP